MFDKLSERESLRKVLETANLLNSYPVANRERPDSSVRGRKTVKNKKVYFVFETRQKVREPIKDVKWKSEVGKR